jgi:hypothetical protein
VIAILTLCEQHPSSRWNVDLLGGQQRVSQPGAQDAMQFVWGYQRVAKTVLAIRRGEIDGRRG